MGAARALVLLLLRSYALNEVVSSTFINVLYCSEEYIMVSQES